MRTVSGCGKDVTAFRSALCGYVLLYMKSDIPEVKCLLWRNRQKHSFIFASEHWSIKFVFLLSSVLALSLGGMQREIGGGANGADGERACGDERKG